MEPEEIEEILKDLERKLNDLYSHARFEFEYFPGLQLAYLTGYFKEIDMTVRKQIDNDAIQFFDKDRMFMYLTAYINRQIVDHFKKTRM